MSKEKEVKFKIGKWLEEFGCKVFDENVYPVNATWGHFESSGDTTPDLVVGAKVQKTKNKPEDIYLAIELKDGSESHQNVFLEGYDSVISEYLDYCFGASYKIGDQEVEISAFLLATQFSPEGYLWHKEKETNYYKMKQFVAYPSTFTFGRVLFHQRTEIKQSLRKLYSFHQISQKIRSFKTTFPHIGILYAHPLNKNKIIILLSDQNSGYIWTLEKKKL